MYKNMNENHQLFQDFPGFDRFDYPEGTYRVTAGMGGEAILVIGSRYTALYDTGMAYCAEGTISNIKTVLHRHQRTRVDYILVSHTHYDHIGALPYVLKEWPDAIVCGAAKAMMVFKSEGARKLMRYLGEEARNSFTGSRKPIETEGMRVDRIVTDGSRINLGDKYFNVIVTKGHTDCSLTFVLEPDSIMFASESTGLLRGPGVIHTSILKSYRDAIQSARKCKNYGVQKIISPHFGCIPYDIVPQYFDMFHESAERGRDFVLSLRDQGLDFDGIMKAYEAEYWFEERSKFHPKAAFLENAKHEVSCILREFPKEKN